MDVVLTNSAEPPGSAVEEKEQLKRLYWSLRIRPNNLSPTPALDLLLYPAYATFIAPLLSLGEAAFHPWQPFIVYVIPYQRKLPDLRFADPNMDGNPAVINLLIAPLMSVCTVSFEKCANGEFSSILFTYFF